MKPERKLEENLIREFNRRAWFARHFDSIGHDGWPDLLCLKNGRFLLIECKAGTMVRKEQAAFHSYLAQLHGVEVWIVQQERTLLTVYSTMRGGSADWVTDNISDAVEIILGRSE